MFFKQSSQQREKCQVIILINTKHHSSLKTHHQLENLHTMFFKQSSQHAEREVSGYHFEKHIVSLFTQSIIINLKTYRLCCSNNQQVISERSARLSF